MIPNAGLNLIRNWLYGDAVNAPSHMAVGTGTAAPIATDTTLQTEVLRKAISAKSKGTDGKFTLELDLTTAEGNGSTLTEIGTLNAAAAGDLLNRLVYTGIAKTSAFELKYEIEFTVRRP